MNIEDHWSYSLLSVGPRHVTDCLPAREWASRYPTRGEANLSQVQSAANAASDAASVAFASADSADSAAAADAAADAAAAAASAYAADAAAAYAYAAPTGGGVGAARRECCQLIREIISLPEEI